ncbi:MAG: AzlD domain-containing protein [Pyramidobacter sp.]|nr:AzlD domain-containing protein [Pyramidobacter sp.]
MKFTLMIALMVAVTYLPRALPLTFLGDMRFSPFWNRFFKCVPFTVMAALIVPEVFLSTGNAVSAACAFAASIILAWRGFSPMTVVAAAVAVTMVVNALL